MAVNIIKFASYNMHGMNNGRSMLRQLCQQCDVILIQEHWLQTNELHKLGMIDTDFEYLAVSSMDDKTSSGILYGRLFGGTGILWRKSLGVTVRLVHKHASGRLITVSLSDKILVTSVYFPCQVSSVDYTVELSNICADLEGVMESYVNCIHLIAGDFNFECSTASTGYNIFNSLSIDWQLKCMDNYDDNCGYTYCHESLGHYSWLDHLFVSSSVADEVKDFRIVDSGCNNSDHHPISWSLQVDIININADHDHHTRKRI